MNDADQTIDTDALLPPRREGNPMRPDDPDAEQTRTVPVPNPELTHAPVRPAESFGGTVLTQVVIEYDPDAQVLIGRKPRTDKRLREERERLRGTHFVHAEGSNILILALDASVPVEGDVRSHHRLRHVPRVLSALVRDRLIDVVAEVERARIERHYPMKVVSGRPQDDLIRKVLGGRGRPVPDGLSHNMEFVLEVQHFEQPDGPPTLVLSIGLKTAVRIDLPVSELVALGVDPRGMYATREWEGSDDRLEPRRPLVGRIERIDGEIVELGDVRAGDPTTIVASEVFVESKLENLEAILQVTHGRAAVGIGEKLRTAAGSMLGGRARLAHAERLLRYIRTQATVVAPGVERWQVADGVEISFHDSLRHTALGSLPPAIDLAPPQLKFHPRDPRKTTAYRAASRGLDTHGPYDSHIQREPLNVAVICQSRFGARVEAAVGQLLDGTDHRVFGTGTLGRFRLELGWVRPYLVRDSSVEAYKAACAQIVNDARESGDTVDVVLVQTEEAFRDRPGLQNPYVATRYFFRQHKIPTQHFRIETIASGPTQVVYSLNNLSLALYGKIGGTAFLPAVEPTDTHTLIVGLRSKIVRSSRLGAGRHLLGVATVFSGDGQFQLARQTRVVPAREYTDALKDSARLAIKDAQRKQGWGEDEPIELIFHSFRPPKQSDVRDVEAMVESLGFSNVKFAFLHLVQQHSGVMIDTTVGGKDCGSGKMKGTFAPPRGRYVRLGTHQGLLSIRGAESLKKHTDGLPKPLKVRLDPSSTVTDLDRLVGQLFVLACSSLRTFRDPVPLTISYPGQIADAMIQFADYTGQAIDDVVLPPWDDLWFL